MFEETYKNTIFLSARELAQRRQCRLMRELSKDQQIGGCDCDGPVDCRFIHNRAEAWFDENSVFLQQLESE